MDLQCFKWRIDANDVIDANGLIGEFGRHIATKWREWNYLNCTIALATNGDRHWHDGMGRTIGTTTSIAIVANGLP